MKLVTITTTLLFDVVLAHAQTQGLIQTRLLTLILPLLVQYRKVRTGGYPNKVSINIDYKGENSFWSHQYAYLSGTTTANTSSIPFPATSLRVGIWSRFTSNPIDRQECWDLFCYAQERQLIWQIQDGGHQFRMQIDFDAIQQLVLSSEMRDDMTMVDQLAIHLYHPGDLTFSMWRTGIDTEWVRCGDFSENKQATFDAVHVLQGIHESLRQPLLQLFNRAPDLFSKCTMDNNNTNAASNNGSVPPLDLCRSFTLSPSATPEPAIASFQSTTSNGAGSQEEWMMHQADTTSSLLTAAVVADGKPSAMDCWAQPASWNWSNMLQQPSITFTAPSSNNNPLADFM